MKTMMLTAAVVAIGLSATIPVIGETPEERGLSIAIETDARDSGFVN